MDCLNSKSMCAQEGLEGRSRLLVVVAVVLAIGCGSGEETNRTCIGYRDASLTWSEFEDTFAAASGFSGGIVATLAGSSGEYCLRLTPYEASGVLSTEGPAFVWGRLEVAAALGERVAAYAPGDKDAVLDRDREFCAAATVPLDVSFTPVDESSYQPAVERLHSRLDVFEGTFRVGFTLRSEDGVAGVGFEITRDGTVQFPATARNIFVRDSLCSR